MSVAWPTRPLSECVKFSSGGTPSKKRADYWSGDIPWVSSGEMDTDRIHETSLHISEEVLRTAVALYRKAQSLRSYEECLSRRTFVSPSPCGPLHLTRI